MQATIRLLQYKILIFKSIFQYVLCTIHTPSHVVGICTQGKICTFSECYMQYSSPVFRIGTNALLLVTDVLLHQRSHVLYREPAYSL
jgi:hypothetical protein